MTNNPNSFTRFLPLPYGGIQMLFPHQLCLSLLHLIDRNSLSFFKVNSLLTKSFHWSHHMCWTLCFAIQAWDCLITLWNKTWVQKSPISLHRCYLAKHKLKTWISKFSNKSLNHNESLSATINSWIQLTHIHVCTILSKEPEGPLLKELTISDLHQVVHGNALNKIQKKMSLLSAFSAPSIAPGVQIVFSQFSTSLVYNLFYSVEFPVMSCHISPTMAHCL